jgi:hypothetical protein
MNARLRTGLILGVLGLCFIYTSVSSMKSDSSQSKKPRKVSCYDLAGEHSPQRRYVEMTDFEISDLQAIEGDNAWLVAHPKNGSSDRTVVVRTSSGYGEISMLRSQDSLEGLVKSNPSSQDRDALKKLSVPNASVLVEGERPGSSGSNLGLLVLGIGLGVGAFFFIKSAFKPTGLDQMVAARDLLESQSIGGVVSQPVFPVTPPTSNLSGSSSLQAESSERYTSSQDTSDLPDIIECESCGLRVVPKADGCCPSCQQLARVSNELKGGSV